MVQGTVWLKPMVEGTDNWVMFWYVTGVPGALVCDWAM